MKVHRDSIPQSSSSNFPRCISEQQRDRADAKLAKNQSADVTGTTAAICRRGQTRNVREVRRRSGNGEFAELRCAAHKSGGGKRRPGLSRGGQRRGHGRTRKTGCDYRNGGRRLAE